MMEVPYHYQFRIIVIGDTMVGKSSLLKTFSEGSFGEMEPTVGVDFFSKIIEIKPKHRSNSIWQNNNSYHARPNSTSNSLRESSRAEENIIVKLQIWDTAGQERFKSIVTSYYRNSVGIVLVYDVTNRESYDHLIDWFTEARQHVEPTPSPTLTPLTQNPPRIGLDNYPLTSTPSSSPSTDRKQNLSNIDSTKITDNGSSSSLSFSGNKINDQSNLSFNSINKSSETMRECNNYKMAYLVLGCKTDLESERQVSFEDGQAFADMYGFKFIETSSKTHHNVDQAFHLLSEEIYDKISECGRSNKLHRTASGGHLTFDGTSSQINEGIRIGPLIENNSRLHSDSIRLLEAQPVSGILGGCC